MRHLADLSAEDAARRRSSSSSASAVSWRLPIAFARRQRLAILLVHERRLKATPSLADACTSHAPIAHRPGGSIPMP